MARIHVKARERNEIAAALAEDLKNRPADFTLTEYYLYDVKRKLKYWITNGPTYIRVQNTEDSWGDEILIGSDNPLWFTTAGYTAWWAFKKWKRTHQKNEVRPSVADILKKVRSTVR